MERDTNCVFAGEPTGTSPNHIGESVPFSLPWSGLTGSISGLYWMNTYAQDKRKWIAPELPAEPTWAAYKEGIDPALELIKASLGN